jgi:hypothetical protein
METLKNALVESKADLVNQFPIGTFSEFAVVSALQSEDFAHSFTFSFWLHADASLLLGAPFCFGLMTITDGCGVFVRVCIINQMLFAVYDSQMTKVLVVLCPRLISMSWSHFIIQFNNEEPFGISICRDGQRLSDAEFVPIEFIGTTLSVHFGGYVTETQNSVVSEEYAKMGHFFLYNRLLMREEIDLLGTSFDSLTPDYLVSSYDFGGESSRISSQFVKFIPDSLLNCFMNDSMVRRLVRLWGTCRENVLLSILTEIIGFSRDTDLPSEFASILRQKRRSASLFLSVVGLVEAVKHRGTQLVWFEDVLINVSLWD